MDVVKFYKVKLQHPIFLQNFAIETDKLKIILFIVRRRALSIFSEMFVSAKLTFRQS